jgi:hypothetical protein
MNWLSNRVTLSMSRHWFATIATLSVLGWLLMVGVVFATVKTVAYLIA